MVIDIGYKQTEVGDIPDVWEVKKLGEITTLLTNGFVGSAKIHYSENNDDILYIQGYNVLENGFNFHGIKYVTRDFHSKHQKSSLLENDLLTVQTGDVGLTTIVPKELVGSNCHALIITRYKKKEAVSKFICYYLNSKKGRSRLKLIETGTTMKHLNCGDMIEFLVPLPPLPEQTAIANALSDMDALIAQTEKIIEKKKAIKQGVMQELVRPKEGWVTKKLGEILKFGSGKDYKHLSQGEIPVYGTGGLMTLVDTYLYDGTSVGIGRKGTIDSPILLTGKFWTVDTLFYTHSFNGVIPQFIYYQFLLIKWKEYNEASGVPSLNKNTLQNIEVCLPQLEEQSVIVNKLTDIDELINQTETKLQKLKLQKQGMMQALLTGKIRLA